jgi:hypothetical protein
MDSWKTHTTMATKKKNFDEHHNKVGNNERKDDKT